MKGLEARVNSGRRRSLMRGCSARLPIMLLMFFVGADVRAQQPSPAQPPAAPPPLEEQARQNPSASCLQPPPVVRWEDYQGPLAKIVGAFGRRLERKSLHEPHYVPSARLCTLTFKDKFLLFAQDTVDPITFLSAGFNAGVSQAEDDDRSYGQGASGYGTRFGFNLIDQAQSDFFKDFAYPSIFREDPRYYRLAHGSTGRRMLHAVEHAAIAHHEDGSPMPNFSDWFGTASAIALSNVYHPDNRRGFSPAAERFGWSIGTNIGYDELREFWPEIARALKLPFRVEYESAPPIPAPVQ
jgi:hypothetical protein